MDAETEKRLAEIERQTASAQAVARGSVFYENTFWLIGRIRELDAKVPKWRDVRERLPEHGARVLAHLAHSLDHVDTAVYYHQNDAYPQGPEWRVGSDWIKQDVAHWMPLPVAPGKVEVKP